MRKTIIMAAMAALTACSHIEEIEQTKSITFNITGDFVRTTEDMSRASVAEANITDVWLFDYVDGTLAQTVHQENTDADFGTPTMEMAYGQHTINVIASRGDTPEISGTTLSWAKVKDTFSVADAINLQPMTDVSKTLTLSRAVAGLRLVIADAVPAGVKDVELSFAKSSALDVSTLKAADAEMTLTSFALPTSWVGVKDGELTSFTLCPDDEIITDVYITATSTDGKTLASFVIPDVSLKRNRMTVLTGEVFARGNGFTIGVNDVWDEPLNVEF